MKKIQPKRERAPLGVRIDAELLAGLLEVQKECESTLTEVVEVFLARSHTEYVRNKARVAK